MNKICSNCNTTFYKNENDSYYRFEKRKFCSRACYVEKKSDGLPKEKICIQCGSVCTRRKKGENTEKWIGRSYCSNKCRFKARIGFKFSEESKIKISESNSKNDSTNYHTLHDWIRRKLGTPKKCQYCEKDGLIGQQIHWASKTHKYKRDIDDWLRLCASCHKIYDLNMQYI